MDESVKAVILIYPVIVWGGRSAYGSKITVIIVSVGPFMLCPGIGGYNPAGFIGLYALLSYQRT